MVEVPDGRDDVVREAVPPLSGTVARVVAPFLNVMSSPLGGVPPVELTTAVKTTA
jgi:hypothetical protein